MKISLKVLIILYKIWSNKIVRDFISVLNVIIPKVSLLLGLGFY
jgi:hypothetical protein